MERIFKMNIKDIEDDSGVKIKLIEFEGELDRISSSNVMRKIKPLIEQGAPFFIMDLSALRYIDSAGIYSILECYTLLKEKKGYLKVIRLNENVEGVLDSIGLTKIISTYKTLEEALKS